MPRLEQRKVEEGLSREMGERFIYHYCPKSRAGSQETCIDGLVNLDHEIITMADYRRVKELVVADIAPGEIADRKRVSLTSLSLLSKTDRAWRDDEM